MQLGSISISPTHSKLFVAGIYRPSAHAFYQEVRQTREEPQNTFRSNNLLLAGDFSAVLKPKDSSSEHVTKKRTTELLLEMIEDFHLEDLATRTNNKQHTWYRRNNNEISSHLDMILTNLPIRIQNITPKLPSSTLP
jgi:hypothetical protein